MFEIPSPYRRPSSTNALGWKPGTCVSHASRPEYDVSTCPLNMRLGPPPAPGRVPSTFARSSSTCCHWTCSPMSAKVCATSSARACSEPVKLGVPIAALAHSTSRSRSIAISVTEVRKHLLAEEADLLVTAVAPQLEHDVRAAGLAVLLDRRELLHLDLGQLEQRVGRPADVLELVREVHARDLARALAACVAVALMDGGDDGAADVDVGGDVLARVADEGRR